MVHKCSVYLTKLCTISYFFYFQLPILIYSTDTLQQIETAFYSEGKYF